MTVRCIDCNLLLQYSHDNSEHFKDELSLVALAGQKRSIPAVVNFKILPVNDQIPNIVNNTGLSMWEGGIATITNEMLGTYTSSNLYVI